MNLLITLVITVDKRTNIPGTHKNKNLSIKMEEARVLKLQKVNIIQYRRNNVNLKSLAALIFFKLSIKYFNFVISRNISNEPRITTQFLLFKWMLIIFEHLNKPYMQFNDFIFYCFRIVTCPCKVMLP